MDIKLDGWEMEGMEVNLGKIERVRVNMIKSHCKNFQRTKYTSLYIYMMSFGLFFLYGF